MKRSWSEQEDRELAQIVIQEVERGSLFKRAFQMAAEKLGRTESACAFRWHGRLSSRYKEEIEIARGKRRKRKKPAEPEKTWKETTDEVEPLDLRLEKTERRMALLQQTSWEDLIFLQVEKAKENRRENQRMEELIRQQRQTIHLLQKENDRLTLENAKLKEQFKKMDQQGKTAFEDYQLLMGIIARARKLALLAEEDPEAFKQLFEMSDRESLQRFQDLLTLTNT